GEPGDVRDCGHRDALGLEGLQGVAGGHHFVAKVNQTAGEFRDAGLVRDAYERTTTRLHGYSPAPSGVSSWSAAAPSAPSSPSASSCAVSSCASSSCAASSVASPPAAPPS